jgi:hypothetical protein
MESFPATNDCGNLWQLMTGDAKVFAIKSDKLLGRLAKMKPEPCSKKR